MVVSLTNTHPRHPANQYPSQHLHTGRFFTFFSISCLTQALAWPWLFVRGLIFASIGAKMVFLLVSMTCDIFAIIAWIQNINNRCCTLMW